jgi:hypothetical protein
MKTRHKKLKKMYLKCSTIEKTKEEREKRWRGM